MHNLKVTTYGDHANGNYGTNCIKVHYDCLVLWFSYQTVIAFSDDATELTVSENLWNQTTEGHLKAIDGGKKSARLPRREFETKLLKILEHHNLNISVM
jgi:hypothetical protein